MIQTLFRLLVVGMALVGMAAKSHADPCSQVPAGTPCEIEQGEPAAYSGTCMTNSTAEDLTKKVLSIPALEARIAYEERERAADNLKNQNIIYALKKEVDNAPLPFYETPWFWLGLAAAGVTGYVLAK